MAQQFLSCGDSGLISGRNPGRLAAALCTLRSQFSNGKILLRWGAAKESVKSFDAVWADSCNPGRLALAFPQ